MRRFHGMVVLLAGVLALAGMVARADVLIENGRTEVHAIGIYEPRIESGGIVHGPVAEVTVDRPGGTVVLVLGSYVPTRWMVTTTPGTRLGRVVLGGHESQRSEVIVDGVKRAEVEHRDLPMVYQTRGNDFRAFLRKVPVLLQVPRLDSFQGAYTAPEAGFVITDKGQDDPELKVDHLADKVVDPSQVPAALRGYLTAQAKPPVPDVVFTGEGFVLTRTDGAKTTIPITLDVPSVSWPMGAARDPVTGKLYGVSLGGEGFLYSFDPQSGRWAIESSMKQADASGMIFDPEGGRMVILISGLVSPAGEALLFYGRDGVKAKTPLRMQDFAGLDDLWDPGNGPAPRLVPVAVAENRLLLRAGADIQFGGERDEDSAISRTYMVDMATGAVQLVAYSDPDAPNAPGVEPW